MNWTIFTPFTPQELDFDADIHIPGLVPAAGRAVTAGLACGVGGSEGEADCVFVGPNVISGGSSCAVETLIAPEGWSTIKPTAAIAQSALTPIVASTGLHRTRFNRWCCATNASVA
jgi:hypothetical protein